MIDLRDTKLTVVILDLLRQDEESGEPSNWYTVELRVARHPEFPGFDVSVRDVVEALVDKGFVEEVGDGPRPAMQLTEAGRELLDDEMGRAA